jgi:hypothetical protein
MTGLSWEGPTSMSFPDCTMKSTPSYFLALPKEPFTLWALSVRHHQPRASSVHGPWPRATDRRPTEATPHTTIGAKSSAYLRVAKALFR